MDYIHDALIKLLGRGIFAMVFAIIFILCGMEINILLHLCWFIGVFYLIDSLTGIPILNSPKFIKEKKALTRKTTVELKSSVNGTREIRKKNEH